VPGNDTSGKEVPQKSFQISAPTITLPKGGGAIRGMGEKFAANPVTGTGSMTIPIATSPGRSEFGPQLALAYDSAAGNGPFGLGWNLSLPSITRKTDKGLPKYQDADESDVFVLSAVEDLVPVLVQDGSGHWVPEVVPPRIVNGETYSIKRYRPRIEGLFAQIERWINPADPKNTFWRSISKDNITTWYGKTSESRIADPADQTRIFSWLICESYDDKGNVISYQYKEENSDDVDFSQTHERNRTHDTRKTNRYIDHILYGNHHPYLPQLTQNDPWPTLPPDTEWYFEVVFDYGEHDADIPTPTGEVVPWPRRNDPFSTYRAGFEVRIYRLCQRVLMFHHFPGETDMGANCLVRSTDFTYSHEENPADASNPIFSTLLSVSQFGYKRQGNGYLKKSFPPVEFHYTKPTIDSTLHDVDVDSLENLPAGLDGGHYQWIDLDGEGVSGILTEQAQGWFYKRSLGPINIVTQNGDDRTLAKFAPVEIVATKPNTGVAAGEARFMDLAGDGQLDLVMLDSPIPGFYEHDAGTSWNTFRPFTSRMNRSVNDPNLKFVDLNGDGHADVLITEDDTFTWHPSLAEEGFGAAQRISKAHDEEQGPTLMFADGTQSIYLADMSGDGLTDLVRIRNGEVCYWPNLGYGRFGAKITMDNAPWFDAQELFDQRRIHLADIDGSGVTDILYLHSDGVRLYFNQSGNSWSQPTTVPAFPRMDNQAEVTVVDLLGNGTACLVWSSPLPGNARRQMRYIDLMGGQKPHLLVRTINNLGAETHVQYASSTKFYLLDKLEGNPWITRLPFPVHVVERVEILDRISHNRFVIRYVYHHGYFNGEEREFRGFGMIEQWDTQELGALKAGGTLPDASNIDESSYVPPAYSKTWFHTGAYLDGGPISRHFENEYYREGDVRDGVPGLTDQQLEAMLLPDTEFPTTLKRRDGTSIPWQLTVGEIQEASRALKGSILRREIYALDGTDEEDRPYSASEHNYTIELLQPQTNNRHAVIFTHARESIDFHYERRLVEVGGKRIADPRVTHSMTLEIDGYGNVLKSVAIGYGRRPEVSPLQGEDKEKQEQTFVKYTENEITNPIDEADIYRTPLPSQTRSYEIRKILPDNNQSDITNLFRFDEIRSKVVQASDGLHDLPYEDVSATGATANHPYRRLIEHVRILYRKDDLTDLLPLRVLESLALPGESYRLAFTPGLLAQVFQRNGQALVPNPADVLPIDMFGSQTADHGGYLDLDGNGHWWIPSGRAFLSSNSNDSAGQELAYARQHFLLPHRYRNPFHTNAVSTETVLTYDAYDLLLIETRDALSNSVRSVSDYRVLAPRLVTDPNGNRSQVAFDALGMMVGTAVMGKVTEHFGDSLANFVTDLNDTMVAAHIHNPFVDPHAVLQRATTRLVYDLFAYFRTKTQPAPQPAVVYALIRETHDADLPPGQQTKIQHTFSYSDGFGREIQKKIQARPGPVPQRDADGKIIVGTDGLPVMTTTDVNQRWRGTGWEVLNNKGERVLHFEPFFTDTHFFEFDVRIGVSQVLFYDPVERVVAILHPNHTWEKVIFDPWLQEMWDVNDTVLVGDPKSDPHVGEFFRRLPDAHYLPTWYGQRLGGGLGPPEQNAATKAAIHAGTPSIVHSDSLGRAFLTIAHNMFERNGTTIEEKYSTRVEVDIEGNQRRLIDANDRIVMRFDCDMLGTRIHQASMDAGERWMLNDVTGNPIRVWDSRGFTRRITYDEVHRPRELFVADNGTERLAERTIYGEGQGTASNHRTRIFQAFDAAGVVTSEGYDFKGNLLQSKRELLPDYANATDWQLNLIPNEGTFTARTSYDALNRPVTITAPDDSIHYPTFNEANLLEKVDVKLRGAATPTSFVTTINYSAKGQRQLIAYGNGAKTVYEYDALTLRLTRLLTTRPTSVNGLGSQLFADPVVVQDLRYTSDPAGNIIHIEDAALKTIFHNGQEVEPICDYTYDAIYRLIEAKGREHIGQVVHDFNPQMRRDYPFAGLADFIAHPNDLQTMRLYSERYEYDAVGNFQVIRHIADAGNWTRGYEYNEASLIQAVKQSNRLTKTTIGSGTIFPETYTYTDALGNDVHGCMTAINSTKMVWDFKDELGVVDLGGGGKTYYLYDASGQRVRKVIEKNAGTLIEENLYIGGFEVYRKRRNGVVVLERETLHIIDDKQRVALVEKKTIDNQFPVPTFPSVIRFQFGNHLGSASLELDDHAQIISYEEYYPYGSTSYQAMRSGVEVSLKRYRYTAMERDDETGLCYHMARYYAPWLGRWISTDPIAASPSRSSYEYSSSCPITRADSNGNDDETPSVVEDYPITPGSENKLTQVFRREDVGQGDVVRYEYYDKSSRTLNQSGLESYLSDRAHGPLTDFEKSLVNRWERIGRDDRWVLTPVYQLGGGLIGYNLLTGSSGNRTLTSYNRSGEIVDVEYVEPALVNKGLGPIDYYFLLRGGLSVAKGSFSLAKNTLAKFAAKRAAAAEAKLAARSLAEETTIVCRFCTITDPRTMMPKGATASEAAASKGAAQLADPETRAFRAHAHAKLAATEESPFLSVLEDVQAGAKTTDRQLKKIITGRGEGPGLEGIQRAPHLAYFKVPNSLLYAPTNSLSRAETELLFFGADLTRYLIHAIPNPFW
jgi:RHS repeat-associated protein